MQFTYINEALIITIIILFNQGFISIFLNKEHYLGPSLSNCKIIVYKDYYPYSNRNFNKVKTKK